MTKPSPLNLVLGFVLAMAGCQNDAPVIAKPSQGPPQSLASEPGHQLGTVSFGASCPGDAAADFDRALALMHHMMYLEARSAFAAIALREPDCAMAHWGQAMTLFQPLWPTRPDATELEQGRDLTETARNTAQANDRERALINAALAFFQAKDASWERRIKAWSSAMATAHQAAPDDIETAALYALAQIAAGQFEQDGANLNAAAARLLRSIHDKVPDHPGATHYLIHANDIEGRAADSLEIVRGYSGIAPDVPHALHMPTHIFVRLGEWPEVIHWNTRSAQAALNFPAGDAVSHHYIHAADYLVYAHLQRGEDEAAHAIMEKALALGPYQPSFVSSFHTAAIAARNAIERRDWNGALALQPRTPGYLPWDKAVWAEALTWFAKGLGAVHRGRTEDAAGAEARLQALRDKARGGGETRFADYIEIDRLILAGWIAHYQGDAKAAITQMQAAAALEGRVEKHPVTPGALIPAHESLGDLLLAVNQPIDALTAYRHSEKTWPGRYNTRLGAAQAALAHGDKQLAKTYYADLLNICGDTQRPGAIQARTFLAAAD